MINKKTRSKNNCTILATSKYLEFTLNNKINCNIEAATGLCQSIWAITTKYHKLGCLMNDTNLYLTVLEAGNSR